MREIKFRGKRTDNGEWIVGYLMASDVIGDFMNNDHVVPETVGQFSGLKDKNGVGIYEGDILTYSGITSNGKEIIRAVNYNSNHAVFQSGMYLLNQSIGLSEVIGNIHDNPELLNQ